jgi:hypothetical protein
MSFTVLSSTPTLDKLLTPLMCGVCDIEPIAFLHPHQLKMFWHLVEYNNSAFWQLISGYVHPVTISAVLTALVSMGVYPIPTHQGRELDTEHNIAKVSF